MFRTILSAGAGAVLLLAAGCSGNDPQLLRGASFPYTKVVVNGDKLTSLNTYLGKKVIIGFWATTCRYSPRMIKRLNDLARANSHRTDTVFLAVSLDKAEDYDAYHDRIRTEGFDSVIHAFSGNDVYDEAWIAFHGDALPFIVVLDEAGKVAGAGHDWDVIQEAGVRL